MSVAAAYPFAGVKQLLERCWAGWERLGLQFVFYLRALGLTTVAVRQYTTETLRLIAQMGLGTGALAVIGGTVGIIGFLTLSTGSIITIQGYNSLSG
ncbi:MAG TPA: ABC transporter permease, partial [Mycobacterium sp.]|nr:ABC transporter permease [Mycobacterium sp.]